MTIGIEKICLVIGEEEKNFYQNFFEKSLMQEHLEKLPLEMQEYEKKILRIGKKIRYVIQKERKGFGHAVYQCREFTNLEPVLLLLGDTLYQTLEERSCLEQLLDSYESTEQLTIGLAEVKKEEVSNYGILSGKWLDQDKRTLEVEKMIEKPSIELAEKELKMKIHGEEETYLSVFGNYILTPAVFECLEKNIRENKLSNGEIQLTDALSEVKDMFGMQGYRVCGKSYDIGNPVSYRETVMNYER